VRRIQAAAAQVPDQPLAKSEVVVVALGDALNSLSQIRHRRIISQSETEALVDLAVLNLAALARPA
jgi:hypothetical protein